MSNTSRRRVSMAAGALLASIAIPIAAAGTAWADGTSGSGPSGSNAVSVDGKIIAPGGGTANVNGDPYVYDDKQSPETEEA